MKKKPSDSSHQPSDSGNQKTNSDSRHTKYEIRNTSSTHFDPNAYEEKWEKRWEESQLFQGTVGQLSAIRQQPSDKNDKTENLKAESWNLKANKLYLLFAFAYPSGSGLHVGHVESKTALDIIARYNRMKGREVFFPVGWDAFGLPAENYAIKTGVHPSITTKNAIDTFRRQIKRIGISYDWAAELATCHPEYYRWTQWLFLKLYEKGLAYKKKAPVNWCPSCQTVLANEQVVDGACERCGTEVVQKELAQWFFKITDYVEELITGLDQVDWPAATKQQQLNWIGRSEGANVKFQISNDKSNPNDKNNYLEVFTTAHDTIFGCTFLVVAPEHPILQTYKNQIANWEEILTYIENAKSKTERERQSDRKKTGVKVAGVELINPVNGVKVPLYVADYVLGNYGTGAIMAVPGQDERDYEFAQEFGLPVIFTAQLKDNSAEVGFTSYSTIKENRKGYVLINSGEFDGLDYEEGREKILESLERAGNGKLKTTYKLRDWLISRQRYWGAPIPVVYDPEGNAHPVKVEHLPWMLPTDVEFAPTGESPLTHSKEFIERTEKLYGKGWRPEFDTMDTFVDSSWYFLRYPMMSLGRDEVYKTDQNVKAQMPNVKSNPNDKDSKNLPLTTDNLQLPFDREVIKDWLPVDFYMIGPEHIVLHLLYSRFFTKFLRDEGLLNFDEPFMKMRHQGMILGPDHRKMSKSKGNVIDPDGVISQYGADTLRLYEMFLGPIEDEKPWNTESVIGPYKFLKKIYDLFQENAKFQMTNDKLMETTPELRRALHKTIKEVGEDITQLKFNTAIATMMEFVNEWRKGDRVPFGSTQGEQGTGVSGLSRDDMIAFLKILSPFAPFLSEELFQRFIFSHPELVSGSNKSVNEMPKQVRHDNMFNSIHTQNWPEYDEALLQEDIVTIIVQVNGRLRGNLSVDHQQSIDQSAIQDLAQADAKISQWLTTPIKKTIFVPGKLINFVI